MIPDSRTIRRTVLASMTKFWPRCLVGRMSIAAASERTSAGPRSLGPAEVVSAGSGMGASLVRAPARSCFADVGSAGVASVCDRSADQVGRPSDAAQPGHAPYPPLALRTLVAIAIWVSRLFSLGSPVPPYACQVPTLNCRPP